MNWEKVVIKLRAAADQHARDAESELIRNNASNAEQHRQLSKIFYGLHAAFEAGLEL